MCSVGEEVWEYEWWRDVLQTAAPCSECGRELAPGDELVYQATYVADDDDEGDPRHTYRCCQHCERLSDWLSDQCGGFVFEQALEDVREHVLDRDYIDDNWVEIPFWEKLAVARHVTHALKQWRRPDGTLRPVPPNLCDRSSETEIPPP